MARLDPHSFQDSEQPSVRALSLSARVDFGSRRLDAEVLLVLDRAAAGPLDLDTRDLSIREVQDESGAPLPFDLAPPHPILGTRLRVMLPDGTTAVRIRYRTAPGASALQWLSPAQTAGGRHPFLFSQCQAIHARSVVPLQDTPRVRLTFELELDVPRALRGLCAASFVERVEDPPSGDRARERYRMDEPIPPYLLAFAVGELESRDLGHRSRVWAEPSVLERAAWEFAGVESMVATAEQLFGPYRWGRFDILVMPPSFPYGGMENPRLTFLTPTLLAGDRSLVGVVAHELAHSWTGNLVTNASAEDFWLNEGFTVFAERRIVEALEGPEVAALQAALGRRELLRTLGELASRPELQKLHQDLDGVHPDEAFSVVPYEKGYLFLRALEDAAGAGAFAAFLRAWVDRHAFRSVGSDEFLAFLGDQLPSALQRLGAGAVHRWLHEPGLPEGAPQPRSNRLEAVEALGSAIPDEQTGRAMTPAEWRLYLDGLPRPFDGCATLDQRFRPGETGNHEVLVAWLALAAASGYAPALPRIEELLGSMGRMKYLKPLYLALASRPETRPLAAACYRRGKGGYHPIARTVVETILRNHGIPTSDVNPLGLGRR